MVVGELITTGNILTAHSVVHVRLDTAWSHTIDSDLLVTAVDRHAAHKRLNRALAARVDRMLGNALGLARDGAHQDDAAADGHVLVGLARDEELAARVDAEDAVEFLLGDVLEVAKADDARVGAADVELAKVRDRLVEELDGLVDVGDVGLDRDRVAAVLLDLGHDFVGGLDAVGVVDDDFGASLAELSRHCGADATAC